MYTLSGIFSSQSWLWFLSHIDRFLIHEAWHSDSEMWQVYLFISEYRKNTMLDVSNTQYDMPILRKRKLHGFITGAIQLLCIHMIITKDAMNLLHNIIHKTPMVIGITLWLQTMLTLKEDI